MILSSPREIATTANESFEAGSHAVVNCCTISRYNKCGVSTITSKAQTNVCVATSGMKIFPSYGGKWISSHSVRFLITEGHQRRLPRLRELIYPDLRTKTATPMISLWGGVALIGGSFAVLYTIAQVGQSDAATQGRGKGGTCRAHRTCCAIIVFQSV